MSYSFFPGCSLDGAAKDYHRSTLAVAAKLGLTEGPVICYQGALVAHLATGEYLLHRPMNGEVAAEVVRHLRELGRHLNAYIDDKLLVEELDDWARFYAEHTEVGIEVVPDLEAAVAARPPTKLVAISDPAEREAARTSTTRALGVLTAVKDVIRVDVPPGLFELYEG